jgi:S-layer protein (TIGR01567 family)
MQQGRVQLDSDWNEQIDIQRHLLTQGTEDVVGRCGAPIHDAGFALTVDEPGILMIGIGHYYVEGILCENERKCEFAEQDDLPGVELPTEPGNYLFYLDVWQRHITAVDDDSIREVALGGPDTATRTKTVWQVKRLKLDETLDENPCIQDFSAWTNLTSARNARLKADAPPEEHSEDPCIVPPGAGYRGLANHLYRVEIHKSGKTGEATFKWSRENGSIVRAIEKIDDSTDTITIVNPGQDVLHAFAPYQWVEITDDLHELTEQPEQLGTLVRLTEVSNGVTLTFDPATAIGDAINDTNFPEGYSPRVRRWDQSVSGEVKTDTEWIALEHGLKVCFESGDEYQSGDYWLIPARAAEGKIEWPKDSGDKPLALPRFGIMHHHCPLAIFYYDDSETGSWKPIKDCRKIFPPMTEMVTLSYVGGDGQDVMLGKKLPAPLEVRVAIGQHPIEGARVRFSITEGEGRLDDVPSSKVVTTDSRGLASCSWQLDEESQSQQAEATLLDVVLLDRDGNPVRDGDEEVHPSIRFNANLIMTLSYVGGDGQEAMPGNELPALLEVRVAIGQHSIEGARVRFSITEGEGRLDNVPSSKVVTTDSRGLASCSWQLDEESQSQQAEATLLDVVLLDRDGNPVRDGGKEVHPSIRFNANQSLASHVAYDPEECTYLSGAKTVQAAIDELCKREEGVEELGIHIEKVLKGVVDEELGNYTEIAVHELAEGLRICCDQDVDQYTVHEKPTCYVTLYMPFPFNFADRELWGDQVLGFQPLILAADANSDGAVIYWNPTDATKSWLEKDYLLERMKELGHGDRVLASLTLKGNFIWADKDYSLYLDGEAFGVEWFWLAREAGVEYIEYNVSKEKDLIVENGLCKYGTKKKNCEDQNDISGGRYYAKVGARVAVNGNPRILSKLILEQTANERQTLALGGIWVLGGGYSLVAQQIDLEGDKVWLSLQRNGKELDSAVVELGGVYTRVAKRIAGETDVPMFVTYVDAIFRGTETNMVRLCHTWLISDDVETI